MSGFLFGGPKRAYFELFKKLNIVVIQKILIVCLIKQKLKNYEKNYLFIMCCNLYFCL